jgi:hypothetical protein
MLSWSSLWLLRNDRLSGSRWSKKCANRQGLRVSNSSLGVRQMFNSLTASSFILLLQVFLIVGCGRNSTLEAEKAKATADRERIDGELAKARAELEETKTRLAAVETARTTSPPVVTPTRTREEQCIACQGSGDGACRDCYGKGTKMCYVCDSNGTFYNILTGRRERCLCNGTKKQPCFFCGGSGKSGSCGKCGGDGRITVNY